MVFQYRKRYRLHIYDTAFAIFIDFLIQKHYDHLGDSMESLRNIVVTEITDAIAVHSPKGRFYKMTDRKYYGMSFCKEGQITYTHNGKKIVSDNKHIIILPQGQSYTLRGDKTGIFPVINFTCSEPLTDTFLLFPSENIDIFMKDFEAIKKLILFPINRAKVMSIFYNMIYNLVPEGYACDTIAPAVQYIRKNYKDCNLTNEILAKECNISEIYLRKLFNKHLKTTPKQYISEIRLQKAKQLLSEGTLKINSISEECGFRSSYHFYRFFKEKTGLTPTEYMKQNRISKI